MHFSECTPNASVAITKFKETIDSLEGREAFRRDIDRLQNCTTI